MPHVRPLVAITLVLLLSACGGTKLVKHAAPVPVRAAPLVSGSDGTLAADLDFVIVRNGPGAWAKNGDWDEYLLRLRNDGGQPLQVTGVRVEDSVGYRAAALADRSDLVAASKLSTRRYRDAGLNLEAGRGSGALLAAGIGAGAVGYGAAVAATTTAALGAGGAAGGGAAAAAGGFVLAAPVLVGMGIVRAVNNAKVDDRIGTRATPLPLVIDAGASRAMDLFFPLSPSPREVTVTYTVGTETRTLVLDTRTALAGLHLSAPAATAGE
jgi:hypothetical protein